MKDKIITYGVLIALGAVAFAYVSRKGWFKRAVDQVTELNTIPEMKGFPVFKGDGGAANPLYGQYFAYPWQLPGAALDLISDPAAIIAPKEKPDPGIIPPAELNQLGIQRLKDSETYRKSMAITWFSHLQTGDTENARYVESQFVAAGYQVREVLAAMKTNLTVNN